MPHNYETEYLQINNWVDTWAGKYTFNFPIM
jgi:hypothetical protein